MGPRRERRGNLRVIFLPFRLSVMLQWGRVVKDAEMATHAGFHGILEGFNGAAS